MKKTIFTLLLLAGAQAVYAQGTDPAAAAKPADAKKTAARAKPAAAAAAPAKKSVRAETPKPAEAKPAEQDAEESVVMIDSRSEQEENGRFSAAARDGEQEDPAVPGGMPSSYGQLKGVMNEAGRTLLVFESPDDGSIAFVQVTAGKTGVAWKLVGRIPRSQD
ncbi:MAG: hypothetical protein A2081_04425 [Elusimicrobia bacterium GWC2_61_19]|nr:MAG: hypothetical protein A2081_04425 [Elusimicrobia bacterium GWC2_61_19]